MKPKITYQKWWHRHSPYHRRVIRQMNDVLGFVWTAADTEKQQEALKKLMIKGNAEHMKVEICNEHEYCYTLGKNTD